jgi:hypothetical protein
MPDIVIAPNPYAVDLGSRDLVTSLRNTPGEYEALVQGWTAEQFERTYAPGKWSARLVMIHLAQVEFIIQTRIRLALTIPDYVVQPFEQDDTLAIETAADARSALAAYVALRKFGLPLLTSLTPSQLATICRHPQMGTLNVRWMLVMLAGHELRHLAQLRSI